MSEEEALRALFAAASDDADEIAKGAGAVGKLLDNIAARLTAAADNAAETATAMQRLSEASENIMHRVLDLGTGRTTEDVGGMMADAYQQAGVGSDVLLAVEFQLREYVKSVNDAAMRAQSVLQYAKQSTEVLKEWNPPT